MVKINENDLKFLLFKTQLSLKKLLILIEDDRDFNLVIDSISTKLTDFDKKFIPKLSQKLKVKLALYHLSQEKDYDINEKSYISDILAKNYNFVYKKCYLFKKGQKRPINRFISVINKEIVEKKKINDIRTAFNEIGERHVVQHIEDWIKITKKSKELIYNCVSK